MFWNKKKKKQELSTTVVLETGELVTNDPEEELTVTDIIEVVKILTDVLYILDNMTKEEKKRNENRILWG